MLRVLFAVSFGIHVLIFVHVFGLYRSSALTYIEMTVQDLADPPGRDIPRPRRRPNTPDQPNDIKRLTLPQPAAPPLKPLKPDPAEANLPDGLVEQIGVPEAPVPPPAHLVSCDPSVFATGYEGDDVTSGSYLEMVRFKIESHKTYPDVARNRQMEGSVTVQFIITPDGSVREVGVATSSKREALDRAAVRAVREAAPFPKPPKRLFQGEIPLEITIVFELT